MGSERERTAGKNTSAPRTERRRSGILADPSDGGVSAARHAGPPSGGRARRRRSATVSAAAARPASSAASSAIHGKPSPATAGALAAPPIVTAG